MWEGGRWHLYREERIFAVLWRIILEEHSSSVAAAALLASQGRANVMMMSGPARSSRRAKTNRRRHGTFDEASSSALLAADQWVGGNRRWIEEQSPKQGMMHMNDNYLKLDLGPDETFHLSIYSLYMRLVNGD